MACALAHIASSVPGRPLGPKPLSRATRVPTVHGRKDAAQAYGAKLAGMGRYVLHRTDGAPPAL